MVNILSTALQTTLRTRTSGTKTHETYINIKDYTYCLLKFVQKIRGVTNGPKHY